MNSIACGRASPLSHTYLLMGIVLSMGLSVVASQALAVPTQTFMNCPANIADNVSNTTDCTISETHDQDFLNSDPPTVNVMPGFFNMTNWVFEAKIGVDGNTWGTDPDGTQSGSFTIPAGEFAVNEQAMLIFKSGNPTTLIGYLLDMSDADTGIFVEWTTPFENPPFDVNNPKDVSHISVYSKIVSNYLPEPGTTALFGLGLAMLGLAARRRRAAGN